MRGGGGGPKKPMYRGKLPNKKGGGGLGQFPDLDGVIP